MTAKVILLHYMFVEITQDKTQPKNLGSHDACNVNKLKIFKLIPIYQKKKKY